MDHESELLHAAFADWERANCPIRDRTAEDFVRAIIAFVTAMAARAGFHRSNHDVDAAILETAWSVLVALRKLPKPRPDVVRYTRTVAAKRQLVRRVLHSQNGNKSWRNVQDAASVAPSIGLAEAPPAPDLSSAGHDLRRRVLDAIAEMPPERRWVAEQQIFEGRSTSELVDEKLALEEVQRDGEGLEPYAEAEREERRIQIRNNVYSALRHARADIQQRCIVEDGESIR